MYGQEASTGRLAKFAKVLQASILANEGSIILNDGSQLDGIVSYDEKGVIKFEGTKESRVFGAKQVAGFEVYDPSFDGMRIFYSLPKVDRETGVTSPYFFELLEDFKTFAVLMARDPNDVKYWLRTENNLGLWTYKQEISVIRVETIYLLKPTGDPQPYFYTLLETKDRDPLIGEGEKTKRKFLNEDLLPQYMGDKFESVRVYAKSNRYSFKDKGDFLKILAYYQTLID
jgi:hypothetical protein